MPQRDERLSDLEIVCEAIRRAAESVPDTDDAVRTALENLGTELFMLMCESRP